MKTKFTIVSSECGDWEALYINGELVAEEHRLRSTKLLNAVGETFKCDYGYMEVPDEIAELGIPEKLWQLEELIKDFKVVQIGRRAIYICNYNRSIYCSYGFTTNYC